MLINCLRSPVCVAARLPCRRVLGGFGVVGVEVKRGRRRGRGGGIGKKGEGRGDNRGTACSCKRCRAINPGVFGSLCLNSSVVMLYTSPSPPRPGGALRLSCHFLQLIYMAALLPGKGGEERDYYKERRRVGEM
ncbi:unnamed protein product [Pleuronectes platessa]|uniref:Uncharacterized protein n=1 Tax=Pleuronectes platessa TaxID=8262 RepID=A0A9N7VFN4_PLEPL|nr:unnamed protein product [Pleuronectes platessa]